MRNWLSLLLLLALPAAGCFGPTGSGSGRDDDDASDDDDSAGDDDDATSDDPIETTIPEVVAGDFEDGTAVIVSGAVTSPLWNDEGDNQAGFWVQDGSGPGTGVLIFTFNDVGIALDEIIGMGDEVTITGTYTKPFGFAEITIDSVDDVQVTGVAGVPDPHPVASSDLAGGFAAEDLYGVLVELTDLTVDEAPGWSNYFSWSADDVFFGAPLFDGDAWSYSDVDAGYTVNSAVGIVHLDFGDATVYVRQDSDVDFDVPGCADLTNPSAVQDLNCGATEVESDVDLTGLQLVSPVSSNGRAAYLMDPAGALLSGIQLFFTDADPTLPAVGSLVDVSGEYTEYRGQSELIVFDIDDLSETGTAPVTPVELASICDLDERHEGMLVSVASVTLRAATDFGTYEASDCPLKMVADQFLRDEWDTETPVDATGSTVTGLVGVVSDSNDEYRINPRSTADWTDWTAN